MVRLIDWLFQFIKFVVVIITIVMSLVVFMQVVLRYLVDQPFGWTEELARVTFLIWVLLGATLAYRENMHLGLDVVESRLPQSVRVFMIVLRRLLVIAFALVMLKQGITLTSTLTAKTPILTLPLSMIYLILPIIMGLILLVAFTQLVQDIKRVKTFYFRSDHE
jgi:TRAP-type C4-dicarboxylate transport system permease small subunit